MPFVYFSNDIWEFMSHTFFPPLLFPPWVERPAEALAHQRALRKFNTNPIKQTHRDEPGGERVAQCISVEITVLS